eukprot:UN00623
MGCAQSDPNGEIAAARIKELENENNKLRKELKDLQKNLPDAAQRATETEDKFNLPAGNVMQGGIVPVYSPTEENDSNDLFPETDELMDIFAIGNDQKVDENGNESEEKVTEKRKISFHPKKTQEMDPFWIDIKDKCQIDYEQIKKTLPNKDFIDAEDERWKLQLWSKEYGEYKLVCNVALINYNTDDWSEDDTNLLFASVSKYGVNSMNAWDKIGENLNREVGDAMNKYSELVKIPLKKLTK